jgi:hypothetical protein
MPNADTTQWPYDPNCNRVTAGIDWFCVDEDTLAHAQVKHIRALNLADITKLRSDPRLSYLWNKLPQECVEAAEAMIEGRQTKTAGRRNVDNPKEFVKQEALRIMEEAEASSDFSAQLKATELMAKLDALLSEKKQVDPVITIIVNTGVPRNG